MDDDDDDAVLLVVIENIFKVLSTISYIALNTHFAYAKYMNGILI